MQYAPCFLTDPGSNVKANGHDRPEIKSNLPDTNPKRSVIYGRKRDEQLQQGEMDVLIAQNDQGMKEREGQPQQADVFMDGKSSLRAGP